MIRVAIVEDDATYAERLQKLLIQYQTTNDVSFHIAFFSDGTEIVTKYRAEYDIIFLDIQMPNMDGMTAAEHIRKVDQTVSIIFITNMAQYAIKGYSVGALDYVLKPISYIEFSKKLKRALDIIKRQEKKYISLPLDGGIIRLELGQIYYIESHRHRITIYTNNSEYNLTGTMRDMENRLINDKFFRCNNCYLVNLAHVTGVRDNCVLIGGKSLQISRPRKKEFMRTLTDYLGLGG